LKKINQFKAFVILTIVVVILGIITLTMRGDSNNVAVRFLNDQIAFVQNFFTGIGHDIRNFGQSTVNLFETYDENRRLRSNMYNVELVNIQNELLQQEIYTLLSMLEIDEILNNYERISAVTIGRDINNWHDFLVVNQGERQGVEVGMAVVSAEGYLIGRITEVMSNSARFDLMKPHNTDIRAHVEIQGLTGSQGIFHGYDGETGELIVRQIHHDIEVEIGGRVITSGLSGVFPRGLLAGYVTRYEFTTDGLTQNIFLTNNVNYDDLRYVFIIKRSLVVDDEW